MFSRWAQPDSIIPQGQGTLAWDRYAYVNNSPLNYTDPTGHMAANEGEGGGGRNTQDDTSSNCIPGLSCPIPTPTSTSIAIPHPSPIPSSTPTLFPTPTTSTTPTPSSTPTLNDLSRIPTNTPGIDVGNQASQAGEWVIESFNPFEPDPMQPLGIDLLSPLDAYFPKFTAIMRPALTLYSGLRFLFNQLPPNPVPYIDKPVPMPNK